jgi:hypothetical protein
MKASAIVLTGLVLLVTVAEGSQARRAQEGGAATRSRVFFV